MGLARIGSPQQNYIGLFDFAIRTGSTACSEDRRQTGDARGVSSTIAAVNVVGAHDAANKFLRRIVQLVRGLRAAEHAEITGVLLRNRLAKRIRYAFHRLIPCGGTMDAVLAYQRLGQTSFRRLWHLGATSSVD
jgi:hypothetical protein